MTLFIPHMKHKQTGGERRLARGEMTIESEGVKGANGVKRHNMFPKIWHFETHPSIHKCTPMHIFTGTLVAAVTIYANDGPVLRDWGKAGSQHQ